MTWWSESWAHRGVRSLVVGSFLSLVATFGLAVAVSVYAYDRGGAGLVAFYGIASTLPAAVLTPALMGVTARGRADRVLRRTTLVRAALVVTAGLGGLAGLPPVAVVSLAALAVALSLTFRPTYALLLPWLARTPRELTGASVAATVAENSAALAGPAVTGVLLLWFDPAVVMLVCSAGVLGCAVVLGGVHAPDRMTSTRREHPTPRRGRGGLAGARALLALAPPGGVVTLTLAQTFVRGALAVLLVVLALETLDLGESGVGWLAAAVGLGGLFGAVMASRVVRLDRLARFMVTGVLLWGLGVAGLGAAPGTLVAVVVLAVVGVGNGLEDTGLFTLVPRRLGREHAAAGLGTVELVAIAGASAGSLVAPVLSDLVGVRGALAALGGVLVVLAVVYAAPMIRLDRAELPPSPDVDLLRRLPAFAVLPIVVIEELAGALDEERHPRGATVVTEGEPGDTFRVVREGRALVEVGGVERRTVGPGEGFGEIALLRGGLRTATVRALSDLTTVALDRADFLSALATTPASRSRVEAEAAAKLGDDAGDAR